MCFAMASCTYYTNIEIKENGKMKATAGYSLTKTEVDGFKNYITSNIGKEVSMDGEKMVLDKESANEYLDELDTLITSCNTKEVDGETVYYSEVSTAASLDEQNDTLSDLSCGKFTTTDVWVYSLDNVTSVLGEDMEDMGDMGQISPFDDYKLEFKIEVTIKMPYKITKTNGTLIDDYTVDVASVGDSNYFYIITEKSTADWTKSENIVESIKNMTIKQIKESKIDPSIYFSKKTTAKIYWSESYSKVIIQCKVGSGKWKTVATVKGSKGVYTQKNLKANTKYSFKLQGYVESKDLGKVYGKISKSVSLNTNVFKAPKFTVKAGKKSFTVKMAKKYAGVSNYEVKYSKNENMKKAKKTWSFYKTCKVKKLKKGTTYYVQTRKVIDGEWRPVYSDWSKVKKVTVK